MCASRQAINVGGRLQVRMAFWLDVRLVAYNAAVICIVATFDAK
jgi:hypothetical protein